MRVPTRRDESPVTGHQSLLGLTPLDATLTSERAAKSFSCNTYEKHTGGEGGGNAAILSLTSNICPPTSRASAMTRRHNADNGDFNSARLTLLRRPMVNVTFALRVSHSPGRDCILEFEPEP